MKLTMPALLSDSAARHGTRVAIRFDGQSTRYDALDRMVLEIARGLTGAGVVKGTRVALLMANRPEWIAAAFGVWRAGGVLVPVSTFATPKERDYVLRHSDASVLLLQRSLEGAGRDFLAELRGSHRALSANEPGRARIEALPFLRRVICLELDDGEAGGTEGCVEPWSALERHGAGIDGALLDAMAREVTPADDAVIVYTSGTTAKPKAVLHAHRTAAAQSLHFASSLRLEPHDRLWTTQPFFWAAGLCVSVGGALASGATLVIEETFDPGRALALIERERVTAIRAARHQEEEMARHPDASSRDLQSVRKLNFASPLAGVIGLERDEWGTQGGYGMTETLTVVSDLPADAPAALRDATNGRVLEGIDVRIIDPQSGDDVPTGQEGEIAVRGRTLMRGYYKVAPEDTFDRDGYFRTDDTGWLDGDGHLHWTGRRSTWIRTGGATVSPAEVETAALAVCDGVRNALAVGVPHPSLGETVVLCVVADDGAGLDPIDIQRALRERVAAYKVPKHVLVLEESDIARTPSGRPRVDVLRALVIRALERGEVEIAGHRYGAGPAAE